MAPALPNSRAFLRSQFLSLIHPSNSALSLGNRWDLLDARWTVCAPLSWMLPGNASLRSSQQLSFPHQIVDQLLKLRHFWQRRKNWTLCLLQLQFLQPLLAVRNLPIEDRLLLESSGNDRIGGGRSLPCTLEVSLARLDPVLDRGNGRFAFSQPSKPPTMAWHVGCPIPTPIIALSILDASAMASAATDSGERLGCCNGGGLCCCDLGWVLPLLASSLFECCGLSCPRRGAWGHLTTRRRGPRITCNQPSGTSNVLHPLRGINDHGSQGRKKDSRKYLR